MRPLSIVLGARGPAKFKLEGFWVGFFASLAVRRPRALLTSVVDTRRRLGTLAGRLATLLASLSLAAGLHEAGSRPLRAPEAVICDQQSASLL